MKTWHISKTSYRESRSLHGKLLKFDTKMCTFKPFLPFNLLKLSEILAIFEAI